LNPAFWDSSALFALCCLEPATPVANTLSQQHSIVVWWATPIELRGAIARRARSGEWKPGAEREALRRLQDLRAGWLEIPPSSAVRERSLALIAKHELRAADSLQLAAALQWMPASITAPNFISGDKRLLAAARAEGFAVHSTTVNSQKR